MIYLALLRGINVGGNNKLNMKELSLALGGAGLNKVTTYINTGNIIFEGADLTAKDLEQTIHDAILVKFNLDIKVLIKSYDQIRAVARAIPITWVNNSEMKCDVMFLWDGYDSEAAVSSVKVNKDVDNIIYCSGALIWQIKCSDYSKSKINKIIGTDIYKNMTARNCNTVRKILEKMDEYILVK
jgi:uncharacterized protein (DUF1697 family)